MARVEVEFKGVSRAPDDTISANGELEAAIDAVNDGDGLRPIEVPQKVFDLIAGESVLCIHEGSGYKHYIISGAEGLKWCNADGERHALSALTATTAAVLGNTVIANTTEGVRYYMWRDGAYLDLGRAPERINIRFGLDSELACWPHYKDEDNPKSGIADKLDIQARIKESDAYKISYGDTESNSWVPPLQFIDDSSDKHPNFKKNGSYTYSFEHNATVEAEAFKADITQRVLAQVNKFIADRAANKNKFMFPFFVRYAYELYDGTLIGHSDPVLLVPGTRAPVFVLDGAKGLNLNHTYESGDGYTYVTFCGRIYAFIGELHAQILNTPDLSSWSDLIKGVNVYVTAPIYTYNQGGQVYGWRNVEDGWNFGTSYAMGRVTALGSTFGKYTFLDAFKRFIGKRGGDNVLYEPYDNNWSNKGPYYVADIPTKDDGDVRELLENCGPFYKLATIEVDDLIKGADKALDIDDNVLKTITNREQMTDTYHGEDVLAADCMAVYNHRLNLGNVTRSRHTPLSPTVSWGRYDGTKQWQCAVKIKGDESTDVLGGEQGENGVDCPLFVYYGDTSATAMYLHDGSHLLTLPLKEHASLNGAYWLADIYGGIGPDATMEAMPATTTTSVAHERSKIYTSDADNPFVFAPERINSAGDGTIRWLTAAVMALSQGQFGQYPLYCFTSEGIWALKTSTTGGWESVQPVARDVATCRPCSIDGSVVFATSRGIMELQGSTTKLLSRTIEGAINATRLRAVEVAKAAGVTLPSCDWVLGEDAVSSIAYDYRHGRIYATTSNGSWVYSIKSGLWTQATRALTGLNSYPTLEAVIDGSVWSYGTDSVADSMAVVTRPLKMADGLQKVRELIVRGIGGGVKIGTVLYGSADWHTYELCGSSAATGRITRLGGTPYKAHSVVLLVSGASKATRLRGLTIDAVGERAVKLR